MKILNDLFYSKDHEWVKVDGDNAYIGITDYAQNALGSIVFVDLPEVDDEIDAEGTLGAVESVKAASDIFMPVSGKVLEVNEALMDSPELVNEDAFGNWMVKVELTNKDELNNLMKADAYEELCSKEE